MTRYVVAVAATAAAVLLRWLLDPVMGDTLPLVTLFGAVAVAVWVGGYRPALLAAAVGYGACSYLFIEPRGSLGLGEARNLIGLVAYLVTCSLVIGFGESMRLAQRRFAEQHERLRTTLASIGDAVITTDVEGRITNMNAVAETLTGWANADAVGQPLDAVFHIVNETTRKPVENPAFRALREGVIVGLANHTVLIAKDGTERPIDDSAAPIRCKAGEIVGCVLVFRDITERKQAEEEAYRQASLIQTVNDTTTELIFVKDTAGRLTYANAATLRVIGLSREQAIGSGEGERFHDEADIPAIAALDRHVLDTGEAVAGEEPYTCADEVRRVFQSTKTPLRDEAGRVVGVVGVSRDITEQKRAEERLRTNEERLRLAQQVAKIGTFEWNIQTGVNVWTPELEAMYGLQPGEFAGTQRTWEGLVHPDDRPHAISRVEEAMAHGEFADEWRVVWPDGSTHWLAGRGWVFKDEGGRPLRLLGINIDITERKQAEEEARQRGTFISGILGSITDGFYAVGRDWRFTFANDEIVQRFGRRRDEIVGGHMWEMFPAAVGNEAYVQLHRAMADRVTVEYEVYYDPWQRWFLDKAFPTKDGGLAVYTRDITDQKLAGDRLRQRELQMSFVQQMAGVGGIDVEIGDDAVARCSPEYRRLHGINADVVLQPHGEWLERLHPDDRERADRVFWEALRGTGRRYENEYRIIRPDDGEVRHISVRADIHRDTAGLAVRVVGVHHDITDRKRAEALLAGQKHILELVATGRPLADVLAAACRFVEEREPGLLCSVLLTDPHGRHTGTAVGPSLPDSYLRGLNGLSIGPPYIGSCGETLDRGETVVVPDVEADERFAPEWRALLSSHGLRAIRSIPVYGSDNVVLASFALYRREPGDHEPATKEYTAAATHLAGIAIGRKRAEEELRQRAEEVQALFDTLPICIFVAHDPDGRTITGNRAAQELLRTPTPNLSLSAPPEELPTTFRVRSGGVELPPEQLPVQRAARGERVQDEELEIVFEDGSVVYELLSAAPLYDADGRVRGAVAGALDISTRKHVEMRLRDAGERLRLALDSANMGSWEWHVATGEVVWTAKTRELFGVDADRPVTFDVFVSCLHPDDVGPNQRKTDEAMATGEYENEYRVVLPGGGVRWIVSRGRVLRDERGQPTRMLGVVTDTTDRRLAGERLRASEERLRLIVESATGYAIFTMSEAGIIDGWNSGAERLFGYTECPAFLISGCSVESIWRVVSSNGV